MSVHPQANAFDQVAEEYERGRPGYPATLLDWIRSRQELGPGSTVVDLAAGTGKLTRLLVTSGARLIAVEPLGAMRDVFRRMLPDVELIEGTAESIPLPDSSADLVTCGQGIKWFPNPVALAEIARVLRPGGEFVIVQNEYDESSPVQRRIEEIRIEAERESGEVKPGQNWREIVLVDPHFSVVDQVVLRGEHLVDREGVIGRMRSSSAVNRVSEARRLEMIESLDALIDGDVVDLTPNTEVVALRSVKGPGERSGAGRAAGTIAE